MSLPCRPLLNNHDHFCVHSTRRAHHPRAPIIHVLGHFSLLISEIVLQTHDDGRSSQPTGSNCDEEKTRKKLLASHVLEKGQRQKHEESKRTHDERSGPNKRSFNPSDPRLAGGKPRSRTRRTMQSSRCDLAWSPSRMVQDIVIGDAPGHACQNTRGNARHTRSAGVQVTNS